jgi:hypothetical protein
VEAEKRNESGIVVLIERGSFYQGDMVSLISGGDCDRDVIARGERM